MSNKSRYLLLLAVSAILFLPLMLPTNEFAAAASGSPTISEDTVKGRITVETDAIKGVWHYKTLSEESNNQSGGSLYELYYKPTDPAQVHNLVSFFRSTGWGNGSSTAIHAGIGGVGSTDLFAASTPPASSQTYSFSDLLGDNNRGGTLESHSAYIDDNGSAVLSFTYGVRNQSTNTAWYRITKRWTVEPGGAIHLNVDWTILNSGYFSELAVRANWSYDVGWDRYSKYGKTWGQPSTPGYLVNIDGISTVAEAESWDYLNGFHPEWVALTGSSTAPTVKMTSDNGGRGFTGSGSYQLGASVWGSPQNPTFEQSTILADSPAIGQHEMNWMAWWSGNPPNGSRYKWLNAGTSWSDSFKIDLMQGSPGGGPDISSVAVQPKSSQSMQVSWNTDLNSDTNAEISQNPLNPSSWVNVGQSSTLTKNHAVIAGSLGEGQSYYFKVKSRDVGGNLTISGGQRFSMPDGPAFVLTLAKQGEYWNSYSDYLDNILNVDFVVENVGPFDASNVSMTGSTNSAQVITLSQFPIALGDISVGSSSVFAVEYQVPNGLTQFISQFSGTGIGPGGETINFPRS